MAEPWLKSGQSGFGIGVINMVLNSHSATATGPSRCLAVAAHSSPRPSDEQGGPAHLGVYLEAASCKVIVPIMFLKSPHVTGCHEAAWLSQGSPTWLQLGDL